VGTPPGRVAGLVLGADAGVDREEEQSEWRPDAPDRTST
jgi:hypothetical protein